MLNTSHVFSFSTLCVRPSSMASSERDDTAIAAQQALQSVGDTKSQRPGPAILPTAEPCEVQGIRRGVRRTFEKDDKDLEITCLENEVEDLKCALKRTRLLADSQEKTISVLTTKKAELESDLSETRQKLQAAEKRLLRQDASSSQGLDKFRLVSSQGMQSLFGDTATRAKPNP